MNQNEFVEFQELIGSIAEYYGKTLGASGVEIWWNGLAGVALSAVRQALNQHVQTSRFMPTISEVLDWFKTQDGRPDAEEAWSIVARSLDDEGVTVVRTTEMARAFGVALGLQEDRIAARMAFREAYNREVESARRVGAPINWEVSLGHDPAGREGPLLLAIREGKLAAEHVAGLLPYRDEPHAEIKHLLSQTGLLEIEHKPAA